MGQKIDYESFLAELDKKLKLYFKMFEEDVCCRKGCSECCEKGDYPLSNIELEYLMKGFYNLDNKLKIQIQNNFKEMKRGGGCPFLINNICSVYEYRPVICRVHGLAYIMANGIVKVPYCANSGKCFKNKYSDGVFEGEPVKENLDTYALLENFNPVIKNLYDWVHNE